MARVEKPPESLPSGTLRSGTITPGRASRIAWDVIVVGAGPAGSLAALQGARQRLTVLLVDRQWFPRAKVCGGCLNAAATSALSQAGLGSILAELGAVRLSEMRIAAGSRRASLELPQSFAISREALDARLVTEAIEAGAEFLPGTSASLGPCCRDDRELARNEVHALSGAGRVVHLRRGAERASVAGDVVVAASGLSGGSFSLGRDGKSEQALNAIRIGAGTTASTGPAAYGSGVLFMAIAAGGYVGLVRLEDGRLNIAAAFDRGFLSAAGGAGRAAAAVLDAAELPPVDGIESLAWKGTLPLTTRPAARALERVFAIGDAAGYVEPFTGEGISWALTGALAVAPFVQAAVAAWDASLTDEWERCYARVVGRSQRTCGLLAKLLRRPVVVRSTVALLEQIPTAAAPLVRRLGGAHQSAISSCRRQESMP